MGNVHTLIYTEIPLYGMIEEKIGTSNFTKVDVPKMVKENCSHAIFFQKGKVGVGSNVYSSYAKETVGLLCKIDTEHIDESAFSKDYTVANWVDGEITEALDRVREELEKCL